MFKTGFKQKYIIPHFFCILTLIVLIGAFFIRLFYPKLSVFITPDFGRSEIVNGYYPSRYLLARYLRENRIPLWTNLIRFGYPIGAEGQAGFFSPVNILLYKFLPLTLGINFNYIVIFLAGGIGTYLLAGELGLTPFTSLLSAVIFTFSGFNIAQMDHINIIEAASFLPLLLFFTQKWLEKKDPVLLILSSVVISLMMLSGHQEPVVYSLVSTVFYILIHRFIFQYKKQPFDIKNIGTDLFYFSAAVLGALFLSAVQFLPSFELFGQSVRAKGADLPAGFPFPLRHLLLFLNPFWFGSVKEGTYAHQNKVFEIFWEDTGYVGIIPLICLAAGIYLGRLNGKSERLKLYIRLFILMSLVSVLLVLGVNSPLFFLFKFPPLSFFRLPSRFLFLTDLSLAILAGLVVQKVSEKIKSVFYRNILVFILIIFQTANIFYYFWDYHPAGDPDIWLGEQNLAENINRENPPVRILVVEDNNNYNALFENGWGEIYKYLPFNEGLPFYTNLLFNLSSVNTYVSLETARMKMYSGLLDPGLSLFWQQFLAAGNVRFLILPNSFEPAELKLIKKSQIYTLWENPLTFSRAFIRYRAVPVSQNGRLDLGDTFLSESKFDLVSPEDKNCRDKIGWQKDTDREILLDVTACGTGMLILSDTYYPGWQVSVDGRKASIYPVNINQRGVPVSKGEHTVSFIYRPVSLKIGMIVSFVSYALVLLILAGWVINRRGES